LTIIRWQKTHNGRSSKDKAIQREFHDRVLSHPLHARSNMGNHQSDSEPKSSDNSKLDLAPVLPKFDHVPELPMIGVLDFMKIVSN
jgi:hypothetical protein